MRDAFRSHVRWLKRMGRKVDQNTKVTKVEASVDAEAELGRAQPA